MQKALYRFHSKVIKHLFSLSSKLLQGEVRESFKFIGQYSHKYFNSGCIEKCCYRRDLLMKVADLAAIKQWFLIL